MFYDCTTLYFESFTEDELCSFGYSKDHKFNQGQALLALTVTQEGLPVGYEVFPSNMYEGDTFKSAIEKILDSREYEKMKYEDEMLRISTFAYTKEKRLIVSHSNKRAEKDRRDRGKSSQSAL
ncbi:MAG: hypothetical protein LBP50_04455 [Tannerella sp.]|jgi:hypothetical protein|nr:hypothetical protein [Tannerella sp.]